MARLLLPRLLGLALLPAAFAAPAASQEAPELVTDRPDQTESAIVLPRGALQLETGLTLTHDDEDGLAIEALEVPGTLLRYGLLSRVELRLAWPGEVEIEARTRGERESVSGPADPELGLKASFLSMERGDSLDLALLFHTTLPVGSEEVGAPRAYPSIRLLFAHELNERLGFGWNVGFETASFEDVARVHHTLGRWVYTGSLAISLGDRWGTFVELYGDLPASDTAPAAHSFDAGVTFLATPALQLDLAAGVGLNEAAPDWFVGAGLSYRRLRRAPAP
jgi:hypothetical protein